MTIIEVIKKKGLKVVSLAEKMGVTRQCIYLWSNHPEDMAVRDLRKLIKVLDLTRTETKSIFDI